MKHSNDPSVIKNTQQMRQWEKDHPDQNWRTGYSEKAIKEIEEACPDLKDS